MDTRKNTPEETLDLMRDEFARIASCPDVSEEVKGLCQRAMMDITVNTPLIQQRDIAEREAKLWERKCNELSEKFSAKISERKTVHEWLNAKGIPTTEETGRPMCLLRRLAVALGVQPYMTDDAALKTGHTAEPWRVTKHSAGLGKVESHNMVVCDALGDFRTYEAQANAARIVACVNFAEGVPNEQLQAGRLKFILKAINQN